MLEIRNKNKFPVQLIVKSRTATRSSTVLNIPGIGSGKNVYLLEEERATEYIDRAEKNGLISTRHISNKIRKGE
jgi:hypothetical protein